MTVIRLLWLLWPKRTHLNHQKSYVELERLSFSLKGPLPVSEHHLASKMILYRSEIILFQTERAIHRPETTFFRSEMTLYRSNRALCWPERVTEGPLPTWEDHLSSWECPLWPEKALFQHKRTLCLTDMGPFMSDMPSVNLNGPLLALKSFMSIWQDL